MEKYFTATTYKNWERVGVPFRNDKNKLYTRVKNKCDRCTNGIYAVGVENGQIKPHPAYNGICLKCNGTGYLLETVRLYTEKEFNSMEQAKERAAEKRMRDAEIAEQEKRSKAGKVKKEWLISNGFNENGITYIYIADDSYNRKEELKAAGWKYHALVGWHTGELNISCKEEDILMANAEDVAEFGMYGDGTWKYSAKNFVAEAKDALRAESRGEWIGEEKEKLVDIPVVLKRILGYEGMYGAGRICTFLNNENVLVWYTSSGLEMEEGKEYLLSATVKQHKKYKGEKQTVITRAKLKEMI